MIRTNETKTEKRIYYTVFSNSSGQWHAFYQPLNPKTGNPWQACRRIIKGQDCYSLFNWRRTLAKTELRFGPSPDFAVWSKEWTSCSRGFSTEGLALSAIVWEKFISGK